MDSFEWNKILGAILGTLLFVFIVREAAHIIYPAEDHAEELAYKIEIPETGEEQAAEGKPEPVDFGTLLQQASAERGESVARRCLQCHTFEKGGPHKTGPNLWGILGSDIAAEPDFRYSSALSRLEGEWTYERVYEFVAAPSRYAPGTSMTFAGLRRQQERINLLAYLRTKTDEPPPIPEPLPEEPEEGAEAPAGEGETEGEEAPEGGGAAAAGPDEGTATEAAEGQEAPTETVDGEEAEAPGAGDAAEAPAEDETDTPEDGGAAEDNPEDEEPEAGAETASEAEDGNGAP